MSPVSRQLSSSLALLRTSNLDKKTKTSLRELVECAGLKLRKGGKHEIIATFESSENGYRRWLEEEPTVALKEVNILKSDAYFVEALKTIKTLQEKVANKHALSPEERKSLEKFAQQFFYGDKLPESEDEIIKFPRMIDREYPWHERYESYQEAEAYGVGLQYQQKDDYKEYQDFDEGLSGIRSGEDRVELDRMLLESLQFGVAAGLATDLREVGEEAVGMDIAEMEQDDLDNLGKKIESLGKSKENYATQIEEISKSRNSKSWTLSTHGDKAELRKLHAQDIEDSGVIAFMDKRDTKFGENIRSILGRRSKNI